MITLIRNPDGTLKTFAERGDDLSLAPGETLELSPLTFEQFAARLRLLVNGRGGETVRIPVGAPQVTVEVLCPGSATVAIAVNGLAENVALTSGRGEIQLSAETPGVFQLAPADRAAYCAAGESILTLEVTE